MPTTPRLLLPYPESTDTADVPRDIKALADRVEALSAYIRQADFAADAGVHRSGDLKFSAAAFVAPPALGAIWLPCDGSSYLRSDYLDLFTALGGAASPWGLPDGTHFKTPDFRGRAPIGRGQGTGLSLRNIGELTGEEAHALTVNEIPKHTHGYDRTSVSGGGVGQTGSNLFVMTSTSTTFTQTTENVSTQQAHNNVGPSAVVTVWIKT